LAAGHAVSAWSAPIHCGEAAPDASRIVVAGGSLTEILYALDEQSRIVAVDRTATYPEAAKELPQIGYVRAISAEGVLSLQPTLVLGEHDMGPPEVVEQLEAMGVDVLLVPETFSVEGIKEKIDCVAAAVGAEQRGKLLARSLSATTETVRQHEIQSPKPQGIVLLGLQSGSPLAAGLNTSGDGLLGLAGVDNALSFEGWKPVSAEALAAAQPDFIVIPERGVAAAGGVEELLEHPALRLTPAAMHRRVIVMDGMAMLGFGPRTVEAASALRRTLRGTMDSEAESDVGDH
jgi:iron complex transport system substrate-binding protein